MFLFAALVNLPGYLKGFYFYFLDGYVAGLSTLLGIRHGMVGPLLASKKDLQYKPQLHNVDNTEVKVQET